MSDTSNRSPKVIAIVKRNDEGQLVVSDGEHFERGNFVTLFPALDGVVLVVGEAGTEERAFVHELVKAKMWETRGFTVRLPGAILFGSYGRISACLYVLGVHGGSEEVD